MLSFPHVELLRRKTKSIYLYSKEDTKPETVSHRHLLDRDLTQQNVYVSLGILNAQRKLVIMPNKATIMSKEA